MTIETLAGILKAQILLPNVCLHMSEPTDWKLEESLVVDGDTTINYSYVNSGVPHAVIEVKDVRHSDMKSMGCKVRYHQNFLPTGTNVDFIQITGPSTLEIRTYERGLEGKTLACGTGIVASGLIASKIKKVIPPLKIRCASNDVLEFDYSITDHGIKDTKLIGPAVYVFTGNLEYTPLT